MGATRARSSTQRSADWAYRARRKLIAEMGGHCGDGVQVDEGVQGGCGKTEEELLEALEFDHPKGRDWSPRKTSRWMRIVRYRRDWLAGNLRLLCRRCNASDGNRRRWSRRRQNGGPS